MIYYIFIWGGAAYRIYRYVRLNLTIYNSRQFYKIKTPCRKHANWDLLHGSELNNPGDVYAEMVLN